jgi:hypothetical protein
MPMFRKSTTLPRRTRSIQFGRQVGPKTQKSARVLDVADAYRVRQERAVWSAGEIRRSGVLGDPVAANRSEGGDDQRECSDPRLVAGHTPV